MLMPTCNYKTENIFTDLQFYEEKKDETRCFVVNFSFFTKL